MPNCQEPSSLNPANKQHAWRLVVCDLDGTLLDGKGRIPPANRVAIEQLRSLGIGFTIASGRHEHMARKVARDLQVSLPIISCNGAIISDYRSGRILRQECLPQGAALAVVDGMMRLGIDFVCYAADRIYYWHEGNRSDIIRAFNAKSDTSADDQISLVPLGDDLAGCLAQAGLVKIVISVPDSPTRLSIEKLVTLQPGLGCVFSQDGVLELNAAGTSKGSALLSLAQSLGILPAEVIAFGDHDNDESMLLAAGLGIAMANATPAAFAASQLVTHAHNQAGVAVALQQLFGQGQTGQ